MSLKLSWEDAAKIVLLKTKHPFRSASEILDDVLFYGLKDTKISPDVLQAILLCCSRGSMNRFVVSTRQLTETEVKFAAKERFESNMFEYLEAALTTGESDLTQLNGLLPRDKLPRDRSRKALCVIKSNSMPEKRKRPVNGVNKKLDEKSEISPTTPSKHFRYVQSPESPLLTMNLKSLVNETIFKDFPRHVQESLMSLLPDCDDNISSLMNNEFFSIALETWRNHLADGIFLSEAFSEHEIAPEISRKRHITPPTEISIPKNESYAITSVSPTKIRLARSVDVEKQNGTVKPSPIVENGVTTHPAVRKKCHNHNTRSLPQNERVTALRKGGKPKVVKLPVKSDDASPSDSSDDSKSSKSAKNIAISQLSNEKTNRKGVRIAAAFTSPPPTKTHTTKTLASLKKERNRQAKCLAQSSSWLPVNSANSDESDDETLINYRPLIHNRRNAVNLFDRLSQEFGGLTPKKSDSSTSPTSDSSKGSGCSTHIISTQLTPPPPPPPAKCTPPGPEPAGPPPTPPAGSSSQPSDRSPTPPGPCTDAAAACPDQSSSSSRGGDGSSSAAG